MSQGASMQPVLRLKGLLKTVALSAAQWQLLGSSVFEGHLIDTFGFMETVKKDHEATKQFYTFATLGITDSLSGLISPFISHYGRLDKLMDEHNNSLLITQQQVEAMFNKYRQGSHSSMTDDLKETILKWKQNTEKRKKTRAELGLKEPEQKRTKNELLSALKRYRLDQMEQRAEASILLARNWSHLSK